MQDNRADIEELVFEYNMARIPFAEEEEEEEASIVISIKDITERKRAEAALKESEEVALRLAEENAIVAEIGRIISSTLKIDEVYEHFAAEARRVLLFDRVTINLVDVEKNIVTVPYAAGIPVPERQPGDNFPSAGAFTEVAIRTRRAMIFHPENENEVANRFPGLLPVFRAGLRSMMMIPLISRDEVIGVLHFAAIKPNAYTNIDLQLAESIGDQIAGAIANAQLFAERKWAEEARRKTEERYREVIEDIFRFVPEALLVFTDKMNLFKHNKAFHEIVQEYSGKLGYTEEELAETILKEVKNRIASGDRTEIRIPKKQG